MITLASLFLATMVSAVPISPALDMPDDGFNFNLSPAIDMAESKPNNNPSNH